MAGVLRVGACARRMDTLGLGACSDREEAVSARSVADPVGDDHQERSDGGVGAEDHHWDTEAGGREVEAVAHERHPGAGGQCLSRNSRRGREELRQDGMRALSAGPQLRRLQRRSAARAGERRRDVVTVWSVHRSSPGPSTRWSRRARGLERADRSRRLRCRCWAGERRPSRWGLKRVPELGRVSAIGRSRPACRSVVVARRGPHW